VIVSLPERATERVLVTDTPLAKSATSRVCPAFTLFASGNVHVRGAESAALVPTTRSVATML